MAFDATRPLSARTEHVTRHQCFGSLPVDASFTGTPSRKDACSTSSTRSTDTGSNASSAPAPNVAALRDQLLRDARNERERRLGILETQERLHAYPCRTCGAGTQTDPVTILNSVDRGLDTTIWTRTDDVAQAEAVRSLQELAGLCNTPTKVRLAVLEELLHRQRLQLQGLEEQIVVERSQKDSAREQVMHLEYELDAKEAAIHAADRRYEQKELDLQMAQAEVLMLRQALEQRPKTSPTNEAVLEQWAQEQDRKLALKDEHIARLLTALGQQMAPDA